MHPSFLSGKRFLRAIVLQTDSMMRWRVSKMHMATHTQSAIMLEHSWSHQVVPCKALSGTTL
jgi:hypothetical protein